MRRLQTRTAAHDRIKAHGKEMSLLMFFMLMGANRRDFTTASAVDAETCSNTLCAQYIVRR
jgi:hypothetical protein